MTHALVSMPEVEHCILTCNEVGLKFGSVSWPSPTEIYACMRFELSIAKSDSYMYVIGILYCSTQPPLEQHSDEFIGEQSFQSALNLCRTHRQGKLFWPRGFNVAANWTSFRNLSPSR